MYANVDMWGYTVFIALVTADMASKRKRLSHHLHHFIHISKFEDCP